MSSDSDFVLDPMRLRLQSGCATEADVLLMKVRRQSEQEELFSVSTVERLRLARTLWSKKSRDSFPRLAEEFDAYYVQLDSLRQHMLQLIDEVTGVTLGLQREVSATTPSDAVRALHELVDSFDYWSTLPEAAPEELTRIVDAFASRFAGAYAPAEPPLSVDSIYAQLMVAEAVDIAESATA